MTVGLHTTNLANKWLDMLGGTAFTAPATTAVKLHTNAGEPGAAGTSNASANTTRVALTWAAASGGSKAITATLPSWASWASGSETLSYITVWDSTTAGNFLFSATLTTPKAITNGDTFTLSSLSFSLAPLAA
jgi:hypothetical protein